MDEWPSFFDILGRSEFIAFLVVLVLQEMVLQTMTRAIKESVSSEGGSE